MVNTVFISKGINTGLKILVKRMRHRLRPETEQVKLTTIESIHGRVVSMDAWVQIPLNANQYYSMLHWRSLAAHGSYVPRVEGSNPSWST